MFLTIGSHRTINRRDPKFAAAEGGLLGMICGLTLVFSLPEYFRAIGLSAPGVLGLLAGPVGLLFGCIVRGYTIPSPSLEGRNVMSGKWIDTAEMALLHSTARK